MLLVCMSGTLGRGFTGTTIATRCTSRSTRTCGSAGATRKGRRRTERQHRMGQEYLAGFTFFANVLYLLLDKLKPEAEPLFCEGLGFSLPGP